MSNFIKFGIRPNASVYRNHEVMILGFNLPVANYMKIPDLIPDILKEINKKMKDIITLATSKGNISMSKSFQIGEENKLFITRYLHIPDTHYIMYTTI